MENVNVIDLILFEKFEAFFLGSDVGIDCVFWHFGHHHLRSFNAVQKSTVLTYFFERN